MGDQSTSVDEQSAWRAVHVAAAEAVLSAEMLERLRTWAAVRMRQKPFTVFNGHEMRRSFEDAVRHAARAIAAGKSPD